MKKIIIALAVLLGLASCKIERDLSVVVQEMMNSQSGLLVNDLGVKYSIKDQSDARDILKHQRVFLTGLAEPSESGTYDYTLDPYEWFAVTVQDCVKKSTVEDIDATLGTSPADVSHAWIQAPYINVLSTVSFDSDNDSFDGELNLMFDDERSTQTDLYFVLKNKQAGKTWEDETLSPEKVAFGAIFLSFPFDQYIAPGFKGDINVTIDWRWFDPNPIDESLPYRSVSDKQGKYTVTIN